MPNPCPPCPVERLGGLISKKAHIEKLERLIQMQRGYLKAVKTADRLVVCSTGTGLNPSNFRLQAHEREIITSLLQARITALKSRLEKAKNRGT